jgi:aryl-alcohol dehydrogenase-like predicted oxidoreductase
LKKILLGNTGLRVSRLAFGTGTNGIGGRSDQSSLGIEGLSSLLKLGFCEGINFWDSADEYGTHQHIAKALEDLPRDDVVILTKAMSRQGERVKRDVDRFRVELGVDVIDIVLLHAMTDDKWIEKYRGAMDALSEAKKRGTVRAVGVSCHSMAALKATAINDWAEVVMVRINYKGVDMDGPLEKVLPIIGQMHLQGKGIIGMKVLGAGLLSNDPGVAIEQVFSFGVFDAITLGMVNGDMVKQNSKIVQKVLKT